MAYSALVPQDQECRDVVAFLVKSGQIYRIQAMDTR